MIHKEVMQTGRSVYFFNQKECYISCMGHLGKFLFHRGRDEKEKGRNSWANLGPLNLEERGQVWDPAQPERILDGYCSEAPIRVPRCWPMVPVPKPQTCGHLKALVLQCLCGSGLPRADASAGIPQASLACAQAGARPSRGLWGWMRATSGLAAMVRWGTPSAACTLPSPPAFPFAEDTPRPGRLCWSPELWAGGLAIIIKDLVQDLPLQQ